MLQKLTSQKLIHSLVLAILVAWFVFFFAHPVFMTPADIGRHIANGRVIFSTPSNRWHDILHTNFYSQDFTDYPFINHHWLSGVVLYLVYIALGFVGISLFGLAIGITTLFLSFNLAKRYSNFFVASVLTFFMVPLLAQRFEVRPELCSYLLTLSFFYLLDRWRAGELTDKKLWSVPLLMILWINLHIYFVLGFLVLGSFWLELAFKKPRDTANLKIITLIGVATIFASLINPSTYRGLLYPLSIFGNYGVPVTENSSITSLSNSLAASGKQLGNGYHIYLISVVSLIFLGGFALIQKKSLHWPLVIWLLFLGYFSWTGVRNVSLFGFFALPGIAYFLHILFTRPGKKDVSVFDNPRYQKIIAIIVVVLTFLLSYSSFAFLLSTRGIGLMPGVMGAADFINTHNISGPLFNDFDSGSYLDFALFPRVRTFVDNRPEAFPADFFTNTYLPMQTDAAAWQKADAQFNFNAIYYSFDDTAPFAMPFIITRLKDPSWAPVYTDKFGIVFLKRNTTNASLIKQFEIPLSHFSTEPIQ